MKFLILAALWIPSTICLLAVSFVLLFTSPVPPFVTMEQESEPVALHLTEQSSLLVPVSSPDIGTPVPDHRSIALEKFFQEYNSPLGEVIAELLSAADVFGLDFALIPAIAMQESTGCKVIPVNSFNCWGYGIRGSKVVRFTSYAHGIRAVAKTLKETYINRGLTDPTLIERRWSTAEEGSWSGGVNFFVEKIHRYTDELAQDLTTL